MYFIYVVGKKLGNVDICRTKVICNKHDIINAKIPTYLEGNI